MKKMNYFAIIPLYGSILILFWLFIGVIKKKINRRRYSFCFYICGLSGGITIIVLVLLGELLNYRFNFSESERFITQIVALIIGGYLMNLYTFILLNKKWNELDETKNKILGEKI